MVSLALSLSASQILDPVALRAASRSVPAKAAAFAADYAAALATADRFLQAWQAGDTENGIVLLSGHAKEKVSRENLEAFFSGSAPAAYEIGRGKPVRRGRYAFPVTLLGAPSAASSTAPAAKPGRLHRRFSSIVVLNTGNNEWAVDKLP